MTFEPRPDPSEPYRSRTQCHQSNSGTLATSLRHVDNHPAVATDPSCPNNGILQLHPFPNGINPVGLGHRAARNPVDEIVREFHPTRFQARCPDAVVKPIASSRLHCTSRPASSGSDAAAITISSTNSARSTRTISWTPHQFFAIAILSRLGSIRCHPQGIELPGSTNHDQITIGRFLTDPYAPKNLSGKRLECAQNHW